MKSFATFLGLITAIGVTGWPLLVILMLSIWPFFQCEPAPACERAANLQAAALLAAGLAVAAAIVWLVKATILWLAGRREDGGKALTFRLAALAAAIGIAPLGFLIWESMIS